MGVRSRSRKALLQARYAAEVNGRSLTVNLEEIDARIEESLENWTLDRLSLVARLILEQALGEIFYSQPPTPIPVVIDEAIELAKAFDTDETAGFVNGVLDTISRTG